MDCGDEKKQPGLLSIGWFWVPLGFVLFWGALMLLRYLEFILFQIPGIAQGYGMLLGFFRSMDSTIGSICIGSLVVFAAPLEFLPTH